MKPLKSGRAIYNRIGVPVKLRDEDAKYRFAGIEYSYCDSIPVLVGIDGLAIECEWHEIEWEDEK